MEISMHLKILDFNYLNFGGGGEAQRNQSTKKDYEVVSPPEDSVSSLAFSPKQDFLIAGSWDHRVRCWEVQNASDGRQITTILKTQKNHQAPVLDVAWNDDGSKVFSASRDQTVKMWDLNSDQGAILIGRHDAPVKTVHWIKDYHSCVMSGSYDKTVKFWDMRSPDPMFTINLPEKCLCADVMYPIVVVGTAEREVIVYRLEEGRGGGPQEFKKIRSPLRYRHRSVSIFLDNEKSAAPCGFALCGVEGRVAIHTFDQQNSKGNYSFKCHRSYDPSPSYDDVYAVNDIAFHPVYHCKLATVGSDGRLSFWDKDARTKLNDSSLLERKELPVVRCCFNAPGDIFAYATSYDFGRDFYDPQKKNSISLHPNCLKEFEPTK